MPTILLNTSVIGLVITSS